MGKARASAPLQLKAASFARLNDAQLETALARDPKKFWSTFRSIAKATAGEVRLAAAAG
jgi:hypothetical protein